MKLFDFFYRHRNKFLLVGGAFGTVVVIKKVLASYEKQWQNSSSRGFVHEARKKEIHFENMINECNQICQRMYPKIVVRLQEILDDGQLLKDLKSKRQDANVISKVEIWKSLKVKILTKLLSEVYCTCMMVCCMRVQMSVAGGQVFARGAAANTAGSSSASVADLTHMKAYTKYIALLGTFYDQRLDYFIQQIEQAVDDALKGYNLDYKIGIQDFKVILDKIKRSISFFLSSPSSISKLIFLEADNLSKIDLAGVCPDSGPLDESDEQMLRQMLSETLDILESNDFKHVLESSIEIGYAILLDFLLGAFIRLEGKLKDEGENYSFSNPNTIQVPLVKILPEIRNSSLKRNESDQRILVNNLLSLDVLNCFAANVYEAFCIPR